MTDEPTNAIERLLPCPFCGSAAEYFERYRGLWNVRCVNDDCYVYFDPAYRDHADCARVWNRRTEAIATLEAPSTRPVDDAVTTDKDALVERIVERYRADPQAVALAFDHVIDRSGNSLGWIRSLALAALSQPETDRE